MKNKIEKKIKFMFEDEGAKSTIQGIKTLITDTSEEQEEKYTEEDYKIMSKMNKILEDFSYTNTGICNALIFLDEKSNINDRSDNYNFNPWKAEWLFTPKYKEKRKEMIHQIRAKMDYRAEISDEEDSVIKYDDIKSNNSMLQKLNEDISKQPSENEIIKSEEEKIVINKELSLEATKTGNTIDDKNLEANSNEKLEINNINNIETENNEKPTEANDSQIKLWEKNYPLNLNNDNENNINNK